MSSVEQGLAHVMILHTSAGLTLNENADPDVRTDFGTIFDRLVPENQPEYVHTMEGPDDMPAHAKSSLVGSSITVPVRNGRFLLGTWQGIYLCEFRNRAAGRRLAVTVLAGDNG
jgi:secondary thiamine-phosphate synthase enzyme